MTSRSDLRRLGEETHARLFGVDADIAAEIGGRSAPGFRDLVTEVVFGGVWNRPGLPMADRMICTLSALAVLQRLPALRRYVGAALNIGVEPRTVQEIMIQIDIYAGFSASEDALEVAEAVFDERKVAIPSDIPYEDDPAVLAQRGKEVLLRLHGERGFEGYAEPDNKVTGAFYPTVIQYAYGEIWCRPGLDRRQRALCALAGFTALRMDVQVKKFGLSALNVGADATEVIEAVIQTGPFSGFGSVLNALAILSEAGIKP